MVEAIDHPVSQYAVSVIEGKTVAGELSDGAFGRF